LPDHRSTDLVVIVGLVVLGAASLLPIFDGPVRIGLALPLAIIAPGYAFLAACLPNAILGMEERALFAIGLSLALSVATGTILNYTDWGLERQSWAVALVATTGVATIVAWIRRRLAPGPRGSPSVSLPNRRQAIFVVMAMFIAMTAVAVARIGAARAPTTQITQLWMLPDTGTGVDSVVLGFRNLESSDITYRLRLTDGDIVLGEWDRIKLRSGDSWEKTIVLSVAQRSGDRVQALLFREDKPDAIYREVAFTR